MIVKCLCDHVDQDKLHGPGMRVANQTKDIDKVRCTVCNTVVNHKSAVQAVVAKKKSKK